jgi:predicted nuclease of predicted toxin-antitoxin system
VKIKLDENLPARLATLLAQHGHEVDTVRDEGLAGCTDFLVWKAAKGEGRFFVTQDLDFSDVRQFRPGTHAGLLLVRLREPGANQLLSKVGAIAGDLSGWAGCFVVLTDNKLRVKRP